VSTTFFTYASLAGIKLDETYKSPSACAQAFRFGRKKAAELFGSKVALGSPTCAPISYGHIACLGSPVTFPEDSEPGVQPIYGNIQEGIKALEKGTDFAGNDLFQHYLRMWEYLKKEFPEEKIPFGGFGMEGPLTTAVLLRGQDFYVDLLDDPDSAKEFLRRVTDSVIQFHYFLRKLNNEPSINPEGSGLADDFASLIAPDQWSEFVVPFWNRYYEGLTTGARGVHVENLKPEHLKYLKEVGIRHYDPSVSPALSPKVIKEADIPFSWRLPAFVLDRMSCEQVREWILRNRNEGAEIMFTIIENNTCRNGNPEKIKVFIETCEELARQSSPA